jgi:hypothetical protein
MAQISRVLARLKRDPIVNLPIADRVNQLFRIRGIWNLIHEDRNHSEGNDR